MKNILNASVSDRKQIGANIIKCIKPFFIYTSIITILSLFFIIISSRPITIYNSLLIPIVGGLSVVWGIHGALTP